MTWVLSTAELGLIGSWVSFYALHSILASTKVKRILQEKWGMKDKNYRLGYSLFSTFLFVPILIQILILPARPLFEQSGLWEKAGYFLATLGVIISLKSFRGISISSFLGLSSPAGQEELRQDGLYAKTRHPMYLGIWLIFLGYFLTAGTLGSLIHWICLSVYLPFGIYWEEQKLIKTFGQTYLNYQHQIPAFFPNPLKKGPKPL